MILIYEDLEELNIPVFAEGDAPADLPDEYYTYSEDYTSDHLSADNAPKEYLYEFTLTYYTKDAETLYSGLLSALNLLRGKGYIVSGVGYHYQAYRDTWFARRADIKKIEYL